MIILIVIIVLYHILELVKRKIDNLSNYPDVIDEYDPTTSILIAPSKQEEDDAIATLSRAIKGKFIYV